MSAQSDSSNNTLRTFLYKGELYIRVVPSKALFRSSLIHEVVNRGDVFAIRVSDSLLTIIPGLAQVDHCTHFLMPTAAQIVKEMMQQAEQREFTFDTSCEGRSGVILDE